jgi:NAD(P)-dependent dehydrogenase (short-subunit alcohol dehydrogenase family)
MSTYSFEGRVAVVTGAGRGIGRGYALLLAERGAKVVVNDIGGTKEGIGTDPGPARSVASEITDAGGTAIPDTHDVSAADGGQALIDAAVREFGRIDIVVNNAGTIRWAGLPEADADNLESHLAVHVKGSFNTTRAAWPYMLKQDYGRVVLTTSTGMFGLPGNLGYATAKAALIGMARSMTASAAGHDIKVNLIAPNAQTRMGGRPADGPDEASPRVPKRMEPELVAPLVAYLAHQACAVSGEIYVAGAGRFARMFVAVTEGYVQPGPGPATIEDVAENWAAINDEAGCYVPADLMAWAERYLAHL